MFEEIAIASEVIRSNAPPGAFSEIVNAVRDHFDAVDRGDRKLWEVADELVKLVGPSGNNGAHNQSNKVLKKISAKLKEVFGERARGFGFENLRTLRGIASRFPPGKRLPGLSIHVHAPARDLATLKEAYKEAQKQERELTVGFVKRFVAQRDTSDISEWTLALENRSVCIAQLIGQEEELNDLLREQTNALTAEDAETWRCANAEFDRDLGNFKKLYADNKRLLEKGAA